MPDSKEEEEVRGGRDENSQDTLNSIFFSEHHRPRTEDKQCVTCQAAVVHSF